MRTDEQLLKYLYHEKKFYGGVQQLYNQAKIHHPKITLNIVTEWLKNESSYQVNKEDLKKVEYLPIYSEIPYNFQIDLTFFPKYKKQNEGYYVLFTAININSRYAYAYYDTNKESSTILDILKKMHEKTEINAITCDLGTEFNNINFINYCKDNEIIIYFVKDDSHKLGIINRFHRTIKDKLKYYFSDTGSLKWVKVIDEIIYNYNHAVNRGIGYKPVEVTMAIENDIINSKKSLTDQIDEKIQPEFIIGDKVRIQRKKEQFADKMLTKYANIIYTVIKVNNNSLTVEDDENNILQTKKINCKIVENIIVNTENINDKIKKITTENKQIKFLKNEGIKDENLKEGKRERKQTIFF